MDTQPLNVLFAPAGATPCAAPLYRLAAAANRMGHNVAFVTVAGRAEMEARAGGFPVFSLGNPATFLELDAAWLATTAGGEDNRENVWEHAVCSTACYLADTVLTACTAFAPDIVVADETNLGAMIAAERYGIPFAVVPIWLSGDPCGDRAIPRDPSDVLRRMRAACNLPNPPEYARLQGWPPLLRAPDHPPPPGTFAYNPFDPAPPVEHKDMPLVWLTLGTNICRAAGLFAPLTAALSALPIELVVTTGVVPAAVCGPLPPNVRAARFIEQGELLPACDLMVCVGGSGTVAGALAHGVPLVVAPMFADQFVNAAMCRRLGVGRSLEKGIALSTGGPLARTVRAMLGDLPQYRAAARRVQEAFKHLPTINDAIKHLETMVAAA